MFGLVTFFMRRTCGGLDCLPGKTTHLEKGHWASKRALSHM
jgi:hypothetical protein